MRKERKEIRKVEYKDLFIADDGTEFASEDECRKYEESAIFAVQKIVDKLPKQITENIADCDPFCAFSYDDNMIAYKVRNLDDIEAINQWLRIKFRCGGDKISDGVFLGTDALGTIQLFCVYDYDNAVWHVGTPEKLKADFARAIDLFCNELVEKTEEGEKP